MYVCVCVSHHPSILLLCQVDRRGLGPNGNPVLVKGLDQNLSHIFVVRVKVKDVPHHVGQTLVGESLRNDSEKERSKQGSA